jgi:serine/threonine protein kinase
MVWPGKNKIVQLNDDLLLGEGTKRKCFAHPDDPGLCIKISSERGRRSAKREIRYLKLLRRRGKSLAQIADYKGAIQTNIGAGDLYELVRDCDGRVSRSIRHYLSLGDDDITERVVGAIEGLRCYLNRNLILFSDIRPDNLLVRRECNGVLRLIIIDGVGDNNQIQFIEYFRFLGIRKCMRKWDAFILRVAKEYPGVAKQIKPFIYN